MTYLLTYIHTYIYTYMYTHMYYMHININMYIHNIIYTYIHTYNHTHSISSSMENVFWHIVWMNRLLLSAQVANKSVTLSKSSSWGSGAVSSGYGKRWKAFSTFYLTSTWNNTMFMIVYINSGLQLRIEPRTFRYLVRHSYHLSHRVYDCTNSKLYMYIASILTVSNSLKYLTGWSWWTVS